MLTAPLSLPVFGLTTTAAAAVGAAPVLTQLASPVYMHGRAVDIKATAPAGSLVRLWNDAY